MNGYRRYLLPAGLIALGLALLVAYLALPDADSSPASEAAGNPAVAASATSEPIIPSRTPASQDSRVISTAPGTSASAGATQTLAPSPTDTPPTDRLVTSATIPSAYVEDSATPLVPSGGDIRPIPLITRFGVSGSMRDVASALEAGVPFGSFFDWSISTRPVALAGGARYWQTIRLEQRGVSNSWPDIAEAIAANPGSTWMIGNEPDVVWQDNVTPQRYATIYEEAYAFIKERDPTALVAIGPVSQPTPLRRAYLDLVLDSYQDQFGRPLPVDVWTVHGYILREEANGWGVGIPPGMTGERGRLYELSDHGDVAIFRQNILDFRAWMAERGYRHVPLAITEFGIIMPPDYGFPDEVKGRYMRESLDFMRTAAHGDGLAKDGGRLVQWWFWYSLYDTVGLYSAGDLYDRSSGTLTYLGQVWADYFASVR